MRGIKTLKKVEGIHCIRFDPALLRKMKTVLFSYSLSICRFGIAVSSSDVPLSSQFMPFAIYAFAIRTARHAFVCFCEKEKE
jgi:hypothetical protein